MDYVRQYKFPNGKQVVDIKLGEVRVCWQGWPGGHWEDMDPKIMSIVPMDQYLVKEIELEAK